MSVKQSFSIEEYGWNVDIYYSVNSQQKTEIIKNVSLSTSNEKTLESIRKNIDEAIDDTGFTYSSFNKKCSIIVIHKASNIAEFINTIEHEKNHLEMHICEALDINPYSEEAAHLSGLIAKYMLEDALSAIIEL